MRLGEIRAAQVCVLQASRARGAPGRRSAPIRLAPRKSAHQSPCSRQAGRYEFRPGATAGRFVRHPFHQVGDAAFVPRPDSIRAPIATVPASTHPATSISSSCLPLALRAPNCRFIRLPLWATSSPSGAASRPRAAAVWRKAASRDNVQADRKRPVHVPAIVVVNGVERKLLVGVRRQPAHTAREVFRLMIEACPGAGSIGGIGAGSPATDRSIRQAHLQTEETCRPRAP